MKKKLATKSTAKKSAGVDLTKLRRKDLMKMPNKLELATPIVERKIDLACGQTPREGFEGVDLFAPNAQHKVDLTKYPWPFEDNSIAEVHCSHYAEHIPMEYLDAVGNVVDSRNGTDALIKFFDEIYRILVPNGWATIIVPNARSNRAFQDPTHRRFFVAETFLYVNQVFLTQNKLEHYGGKCNFGIDVSPIIPAEYGAWTPEVQARRFTHEWNVIVDWQARLQAIKPAPAPSLKIV